MERCFPRPSLTAACHSLRQATRPLPSARRPSPSACCPSTFVDQPSTVVDHAVAAEAKPQPAAARPPLLSSLPLCLFGVALPKIGDERGQNTGDSVRPLVELFEILFIDQFSIHSDIQMGAQFTCRASGHQQVSNEFGPPGSLGSLGDICLNGHRGAPDLVAEREVLSERRVSRYRVNVLGEAPCELPGLDILKACEGLHVRHLLSSS